MASPQALRIGFVPEHFSIPLHFARELFGLDAVLVPFPSGTGQMITALGGGEIDVGIGLTEAWIAGLGKKREGEEGGYRLIGSYVDTPLCWAISTGAQRAEVSIDSLQGGRIGVSRMGSGSHVMGFVLADGHGWLTAASQQAAYSEVVELGTFEKLRRAANEGAIDFFMWEHFTSKKYHDAGEIRRLGDIYTPWSSWMMAASGKLLSPGPDGEPDGRLGELHRTLKRGIEHFNQHHDEAVAMATSRLGYSEADARAWIQTVRFSARTEAIRPGLVADCIEGLVKAGVLQRGAGMTAHEMVASCS